MGLGVAAGLIMQLSNAIVGGLPLALGGAFAAIPFFTLIRSGMEKEKGKWHTLNNEMGKQLDKIVNKWKVFKVEISKPWKPVVMSTLAGLKGLMDDLETPLTRIGKAIAPAFGKLMQGVFDSIKAFVKAVEPAMPGVAEGLKTWAKEMPRIATAIGEFIAELLKDPEKVHNAIVDLVDFIVVVVKDGAAVVSFIAGMAREYKKFSDAVDSMESDPEGPFAGIGKAFTTQADDLDAKITERVAGWGEKMRAGLHTWIGPSGTLLPMFKEWAGKVGDVFKGMEQNNPPAIERMSEKIEGHLGDLARKALTKTKEMWAGIKESYRRDTLGIVGFTSGMKTKVVDWIKRMWSEAKASFLRTTGEIAADVTRWKTKLISYVTDLKTRFVSWVKRMWSEAKTSFTQNHTSIAADVTRWKTKLIAYVTDLKTRFVSWVKRMWSEAKTSFIQTMPQILADVNRWKDKVVNAFRTAKANIKKIWDGLKDVVKAPITWIKDNVYNKPLVPVWNRVAGLVNGPTLKAYKEGGPITGPRHGRDNVLGVSANGTATARVEPGEWVAPRWMSSLFPQLESIRKQGRSALQEPGDPKGLPGFAGGGVVGWLSGLASSAGAKLGDLKDRMKDWALGGLRALAEKILNPVKAAIGQAMPRSGVGDTVGGVGKKLIALILDKIEAGDKAAMPTGGPAGSAIASGGWASIYKILRNVGGPSTRFTTYAGHDQGASRSRDIWSSSKPQIAEAARRLSSIWYVIFNRRIASKMHGNTWRPYTRSNPHTDHVHVTLLPGVASKLGGQIPTFDKGGILPPGLSLAYNGTGKNEIVSPMSGSHAAGKTFSPTINLNVPAGLDPIDAGARRALVKALWLELDSYEKDYMRR